METTTNEQRQKDFNTVWQWFVVDEKSQSMEKDDTPMSFLKCVYNGPNGLRCAYGVLLTDDELERTSDFEGNRAGVVIAELQIERHWSDSDFYDVLQRCHDLERDHKDIEEAFPSGHDLLPEPENFTPRIKKRLELFASSYTLTVPA